MMRIRSGLHIFLLGTLALALAYVVPIEAQTKNKSVGDILNSSPLTTQSDRNAAFGGCTGDPYAELERYKGGGANRCNPGGVQITPRAGQVGGIDSALACRLTKLFKAATDRGCRVSITSAYRSPQTQQCMCGAGRSGCAAAGNSCHQPGRAVDVSSSCIGWLRMAAPQFRLVFPYYGDHIQCAEHPSASTRSCNRPCDGGQAINPDLSSLPPPSQVPETYWRPPAAAPSSGISDQFRDMISPPQQAMCSLPGGGQVPCSAIANPGGGGAQPPMMPVAPPSPLPQNQQPLQNAETAQTPISESLQAAKGAVPTTTKAAIDLINALALPQGISPTSATSAPLVLTIGSADAVRLDQGKNTLTGETVEVSGQQILPGSQQTFTSEDLANSPNSESPQRSALQATLAKMKDVLLRALAYLRPFGRPLPPESEGQQYHE